MSKKSAIGANVLYCGHKGYFVADIVEIENAVVVSTEPVSLDKLVRDERFGPPTHHLVDFPGPVYWKPSRGVFVVPSRNVLVLNQKL